MTARHSRYNIRSAARGVVMIYMVICMLVMVGFCSLSVDLGRVQMVKTELHRTADAAARAGAANLSQGTSAVQRAAVSIAGANTVNGTKYTLGASNITIGLWNIRSRTFSAGGSADDTTTFPAVQVKASCTKANGNPIQLVFGQIIGISTCDANATSVAALISVNHVTGVTVYANSDPWLAGEPAGTLASENDPGYVNSDHEWKRDIAGTYHGTDPNKLFSTDYANNQPYGTPYEFDLPAGWAGSVIQLSVTGGPGAKNDPAEGTYTDARGNVGGTTGSQASYSDDAATNPNAVAYTGVGNANSATNATGSEHGISNISTPINSLVGVFLNDKVPDTEGTPPPGMDFSSQSAQDYTAFEPQLRQTFFAGNGQTSNGIQQSIVVPAGATRLFFGTMDGHEWSNNSGYFIVNITQYEIEIVK